MIKELIENILHESINGQVEGTGKISTVSGKIFFLKSGYNSRTYCCEANGLKEISLTKQIRTPKVFAVGENFILTEYIENRRGDNSFYIKFGQQLARMHKYFNHSFGFYEDNFIGANTQYNIPDENEGINWIDFYFNKRLLFQYKLAEKNNYVSKTLANGFSRLEAVVQNILKGSEEPPCLLHGDLWSGNYLCTDNNEVVLIDPAVYYGHREADLAMTKVFGSFPHSFYKAYMEEYPLPENWQYRENIYKLYHVLNHLNLFGRSYLSEAEYLVQYYIK